MGLVVHRVQLPLLSNSSHLPSGGIRFRVSPALKPYNSSDIVDRY